MKPPSSPWRHLKLAWIHEQIVQRRASRQAERVRLKALQDADIERQVRRLYEASRFVNKEKR